MSAVELAKAAALRASLNSRPAQREAAAAKADKNAKAASQFEQDFNLADENFGLDRSGEREQALEAAKNDPVNARICYAAIAASFRPEVMGDVNARIRARIEKERKCTG